VLREREPMKAKVEANWQIEKQMHDYFVHTIKELQGNDSTSQVLVDRNGPRRSNWAGL